MMTEQPITSDEHAHIDGCVNHILGYLVACGASVVSPAPPAEELRALMAGHPQVIVEAIHNVVEGYSTVPAELRQQMREGVDLESLAVGYGTLWGDQICNQLSWTWVKLHDDVNDADAVAIVSPDKAYCCPCHQYMYATIGQSIEASSDRKNTIGLLYNMIMAGNLPPAEPGSYAILN